ncbi:MAG: GTP-binding protein, partial [Candidatus Nanopelagicales bacterium]
MDSLRAAGLLSTSTPRPWSTHSVTADVRRLPEDPAPPWYGASSADRRPLRPGASRARVRGSGRSRLGEGTVTTTDPASIRNVALVGPSHAGKTSLVERLALATGAISRVGSVQEGTTLSDIDDAERRQQ